MSLRKLSDIIDAQKNQEKSAMHNRLPSKEYTAQASGAKKRKIMVVDLFNHMGLFNHVKLATLVAQSARVM